MKSQQACTKIASGLMRWNTSVISKSLSVISTVRMLAILPACELATQVTNLECIRTLHVWESMYIYAYHVEQRMATVTRSPSLKGTGESSNVEYTSETNK